MTQQIKKAFQEIDLPDKISWITDDWMLWSPKKYYEMLILELETCNKVRAEIIKKELRRLYKAFKPKENGR